MAPLWRLAGNPDYDRSIDFIADRLAGGLPGGQVRRVRQVRLRRVGRIDRTKTAATAGSSSARTLSIEGDRRAGRAVARAGSRGALHQLVLDRARRCRAAAGRCGRRRGGGLRGQGRQGRGRLGDAAVGGLWTRAVRERGAAGRDLDRPRRGIRGPMRRRTCCSGAASRIDEACRSFGFKATPRAAVRLRDALAAGARPTARGHRDDVPSRPEPDAGGRDPGHVSEVVSESCWSRTSRSRAPTTTPAAPARLLAAALAIDDAIAKGAVAAAAANPDVHVAGRDPRQRAVAQEDAARAGRVVAMMSLDMTGQDTAKTGGTFLIEKLPDPSAIWPRPSDPHSEWGAGKVDRAWCAGICSTTSISPSRFGAPATPAGSCAPIRTKAAAITRSSRRAGVPALLNWHFTDRYYHTNLDTLDKTSAATMGHVAATVATSAMFLASADSVGYEPALAAAAGRSRTRPAGDGATQRRQRRDRGGLEAVVQRSARKRRRYRALSSVDATPARTSR